MDDILVRPAAEGDHIALAALMTALDYPSSPEQMKARMRRIGAQVNIASFVAERRGEIVGMVGVQVSPSFEHDEPAGTITALVTAESARRRGVGRLLAARAEAWARQRGASNIKANSHRRRRDAHAFYRGIGYEQTGLRFVKDLTA